MMYDGKSTRVLSQCHNFGQQHPCNQSNGAACPVKWINCRFLALEVCLIKLMSLALPGYNCSIQSRRVQSCHSGGSVNLSPPGVVLFLDSLGDCAVPDT